MLIAVLCVMATESQNSSYRMKMPSEIIKMNVTLYSIFHVSHVLKMEKWTHEQYFSDRDENEHSVCRTGTVQLSGNGNFPQRDKLHSPSEKFVKVFNDVCLWTALDSTLNGELNSILLI